MGILWGRLVAWIAGGSFAMFGAWKVFIVGGFLAFLAVSLYSLFLYAVTDITGYMSTTLGAVSAPGGVASIGNFTGFIGWFASTMKLPQCLSFIVDVVLLKWTLRKIPFIKW